MPAPIVHFEIGVRDIKKAQAFYGPLFGWEFSPYGDVVMVGNVGPMAGTEGIGGHMNSLGHEPHTYVTIYAQVDDLKATLEHAAKLGGKQIVPPTEVPEMGWFAWLSDPEGNIVGLWKAMQR